MKDHHDLGNKKTRNSSNIKSLKHPVTMRLDGDTIKYFKTMSEDSRIPYQTLINLYLRDCAVNKRSILMKWTSDKDEEIRD